VAFVFWLRKKRRRKDDTMKAWGEDVLPPAFSGRHVR
jgi:hypothetical protein